MPDKKLTDREIVKALPFLAKYCKDEYNDIRVDEVLLGAFDLINCLEARIGIYETCNARKDEEIKHLEAENESIRRKSLLEAASKFAGHSNYHGDTILCKLICMAEGKEVGTAKPLDMSEIKAEAYKECIDMVKKKGVKVGVDEICIFTNTLDNLLKEKVKE